MSDRYTAPYINFQGRAREALEFYHEILGGTLSLYTFDGSGALKTAGANDPIGYGRLQAEGVRLFGSDGNPAYPTTPGDNIAVTLAGPNKEGMTMRSGGRRNGEDAVDGGHLGGHRAG